MSILEFREATTDNVRLSYTEPVTSSDVVLHYHTPDGYNPKAAGDLIAFYEADDHGNVKPDAIPLQISKLIATSSESDVRIEDLPRQQRSYAFAYIQGDTPAPSGLPFSDARVSALLALPKNAATSDEAYHIELEIASRGDVVVLTYQAVPHTEPAKSSAWIGLWKNDNLDLTSPPEIYYPLTRKGALNTLQIDGLRVNTEYYLGYFQDGYNATKPLAVKNHMAACVIFRTVF